MTTTNNNNNNNITPSHTTSHLNQHFINSPTQQSIPNQSTTNHPYHFQRILLLELMVCSNYSQGVLNLSKIALLWSSQLSNLHLTPSFTQNHTLDGHNDMNLHDFYQESIYLTHLLHSQSQITIFHLPQSLAEQFHYAQSRLQSSSSPYQIQHNHIVPNIVNNNCEKVNEDEILQLNNIMIGADDKVETMDDQEV